MKTESALLIGGAALAGILILQKMNVTKDIGAATQAVVTDIFQGAGQATANAPAAFIGGFAAEAYGIGYNAGGDVRDAIITPAQNLVGNVVQADYQFGYNMGAWTRENIVSPIQTFFGWA